jgi:hypoxanthine phosphoribosyltransferase
MQTEPRKGDIEIINNEAYRVIITAGEIEQKIYQLAEQIKKDFANSKGPPPILMGIMTGAMFTVCDLARALGDLSVDTHIDSIHIHSYKKDEHHTMPKIIKAPSADLSGRHVIVVEDLVDSGESLDRVDRLLKLKWPKPFSVSQLFYLIKQRVIKRKKIPASVLYFILGSKKESSQLKIKIDYLGFKLPPGWLVGRGMDANQSKRNLRYVLEKVD